MKKFHISSGFIEEVPSLEKPSFSQIKEIYISNSGYNQLFRGERYGRVHILKALQSLYIGKPFYEQVLRKEFNIGYQLEHPNICHTLGWEEINGLGHCIILEYIDGANLKEFINQNKLTVPLAYKFIKEICDALHYLHSKQIVHRDLKPENILVSHNGYNIKIIDFGLSDCDDYEILKLPAGTRYYLAPEAIQSGNPLDSRSDIYSLGVIIGEMAEKLKNKKLAAISRKCTQRNPYKRYCGTDEIIQVLEKKQTFKTSHIISSITVGITLIFAVLWGTFAYTKKTSIMTGFPTYGNTTYTYECQQVLKEIKNKLQDSTRYTMTKTDSLLLIQELEKALKKSHPLPIQQKSSTYQAQWNAILKEVARLTE